MAHSWKKSYEKRKLASPIDSFISTNFKHQILSVRSSVQIRFISGIIFFTPPGDAFRIAAAATIAASTASTNVQGIGDAMKATAIATTIKNCKFWQFEESLKRKNSKKRRYKEVFVRNSYA